MTGQLVTSYSDYCEFLFINIRTQSVSAGNLLWRGGGNSTVPLLHHVLPIINIKRTRLNAK